MDTFLISNLLITIAFVLQLFSIQYSTLINPITFLLISLSTFIMAYSQYKYKSNHKVNVPLKLVNGILATLIFIKVYQAY